MKKYFLFLIVVLFGCDPAHKYVIYNNYYSNVLLEVEENFNGRINTKQQNIKYGKSFEMNFLGGSFKTRPDDIPYKIKYHNNEKYFTYNREWIIQELKKNNLLNKTNIFLIINEDGLYPISQNEFRKLVKNKSL